MALRLHEVHVNIALPGGGPGISGTWRPDDHERQAAWEMYVELATRVATVPLTLDEGSLREALSSYYSLFETTRKILREHGPVVARAKANKQDSLSFGDIAVTILNDVVRPLLATWHQELEAYEFQRPPNTSKQEWERTWSRNEELRGQIEDVRKVLVIYADLLAKIAGVRLMMKPAPTGSKVSR